MNFEELNTYLLSSYSWLDFKIKSFQGDNLLVVASEDLTYSHEVELLFQGVTYVEMPMEFTWDKKIKLMELVQPMIFLDKEKQNYLYENVYITGTKMYQFNEDEGQRFYIIAENLKINLIRIK